VVINLNPLAYEEARKRLANSDDAKRFLPFYRNTLKPVLHSAIIKLLSDKKTVKGDRELLALAEFAKLVEDMDEILKRVINSGERAEKVIEEVLRNVS